MSKHIRGWSEIYSERAALMAGTVSPEDRAQIDALTAELEEGCPIPLAAICESPCPHTVIDLEDADAMALIEGRGGFSLELWKFRVVKGEKFAWASVNVRKTPRGLKFEIHTWGPDGGTRRAGRVVMPSAMD